jgi:cyclophilin family peptidyl-prolyl cis-trans isomerase
MPQQQKRQRKKEGRQARQQAELAARRRRSRRNTLIATGVVMAVVIGLIAALSPGGGGKSKSTKAESTNTTAAPAGAAVKGDTPCPQADGSSPRTTKFAKPPPICIDPAKTYTATIATAKGTMKVALDAKAAPKTVNNFVVLARYHFYDGLTFHRIVPDFVIQGGDPQGNGGGGPGYEFADELPAAGQYKIGSLAMANSGPNTNGSQFFIIIGQQGVGLPPQYSLFGQVTEGIDAVNAIAKLAVPGAANGRPSELVKMTSVTISES